MMLDGIKVLDLSRILAGPYVCMLMGDLGADVIKLERPGRGDDLRWLRGGDGLTASFATMNRNKRAIAVDLTSEKGKDIAFKLACEADVIVENFLPGVVAKHGLGYEAVKAENPSVVFASITGFGQDGPYASRGGYNSLALGMGGMMGLTGMPGNPPTRPGGSLADVASAYVALGTINAALVKRFRTDEGSYLDINLLASTLGLLPDPVANYFESGVEPTRLGNRSPSVTPGEVFPTADGLITIVLTGIKQWKAFCTELGDLGMTDHPKFSTNALRLANHAEFKARVDAILLTRNTEDWVQKLIPHSIAAGPVYEFPEVFEDPQVQHLGLVAEIAQPGLGDIKMLNFPVRLSPSAASIRRPAPWLGEHTTEILAEIGYSEDQISSLAEVGTIEIGGPPEK